VDIKATLNGIDFSDSIKGLSDLKYIFLRESGFRNSEQIFRELVEVDLLVSGDAYNFINDLRKNNPCVEISIQLYDVCDGFDDLNFDGTILQRFLIKNIGNCTFTITTIKDNSFSAFIRDVIDLEVWTFNTQTLNCETITLIPTIITSIATSIPNILSWDALDLLNYLVGFLSDNKITVQSTFLTTNKIAITTGYNLHNTNIEIEKSYPKLSYSQVFGELRKKFALFMSLEGNVIKIEPENDFFINTKILDLTDFSLNAIEQINQDNLFNAILVGSEDTVMVDTDNTVVPQKSLTAWNKETFFDCGGCGAEKGNDLDAVSNFIIDANLIHEALTTPIGDDYEHDDSIFMVNYFIASPTVNFLVGQIALPPSNYNEILNNENVLNRWVGVANACYLLKSFYKYGFDINNNQNIQLSSFAVGSGGFTDISINRVRFGDPIQNILSDNENSLFNDNLAPDPFTYFLCQESGIYKFYTNANIKQDISGIFTPVVGAILTISLQSYVDSTLTTLIDSFDFTIPSSGNLASIEEFMEVEGSFNLSVGNVVIVSHRFEYSGFGPVQYIIFSSPTNFRLISDGSACQKLTEQGDIFKPYETELEAILCKDDFNKIKANRGGYIPIYGEKCWIKRIEYLPKKKSKLILMHKKTINI